MKLPNSTNVPWKNALKEQMHFNSTPILRASFALYDFLFGSHSTIWLHQHLKMIFEDVRLAREFHWGNVNRHSQHIWLLKNKATDKLHTRENKHTPDLKEEEQFDFDQCRAFSRFLQTEETQSRVLQNQACKEAALQNTPSSAGEPEYTRGACSPRAPLS